MICAYYLRPVPTKWETSRKISFLSYNQIHVAQTLSFKMIYYLVMVADFLGVQKLFFPCEIPLFSIDFWNVQWAISPLVPWRLVTHFVRTGLICEIYLFVDCMEDYQCCFSFPKVVKIDKGCSLKETWLVTNLLTQQDYYGRRCGTLLHSNCTSTYTEVTVLLLWSSSNATLEYPRRYSYRVAVWVLHGNSRVTSQEQHGHFSVGQYSNCVIEYHITGHSNLAVY